MYRCYKTNQVVSFRTSRGNRFLCQLKHRRHHHMSISMAIFKMPNKCWQRPGERRNFRHWWRKCKWTQSLWETLHGPQRKEKRIHDPITPLVDAVQGPKLEPHQGVCTPIFPNIIPRSQGWRHLPDHRHMLPHIWQNTILSIRGEMLSHRITWRKQETLCCAR